MKTRHSRLASSLTFLLIACASGATWISGCAGGDAGVSGSAAIGSASKNVTVGSASFTIRWPKAATRAQQPTRLIPADSNSIQVDLTSSDGTVNLSKLLPRPSSGSSTTAEFDNVVVGTYAVTATAFPNADGTGTAQATGTVPLTIVANQVTPFTLTMGSTIDHLVVLPANATIQSGATEQMTAAAYDATGAVVLVSSGEIGWTIGAGSSAIATVDAASGLVTAGATPGTAQITATDEETITATNAAGASGTTSVTVVSPPPTPTPTGNAIGTIQ